MSIRIEIYSDLDTKYGGEEGKMLYERIKKRAAEVPISINQLEKTIGVSSGSICKWDTNRPSIDKVKRVADVLSVTIDSLLEDENAELHSA